MSLLGISGWLTPTASSGTPPSSRSWACSTAFWALGLLFAALPMCIPSPMDRHLLPLGLGPLRVQRTGARTLELSGSDRFLTSLMDRGFVHRDRPLDPGFRASMGEMTVEVTAVNEVGAPSRLVCTFPGRGSRTWGWLGRCGRPRATCPSSCVGSHRLRSLGQWG